MGLRRHKGRLLYRHASRHQSFFSFACIPLYYRTHIDLYIIGGIVRIAKYFPRKCFNLATSAIWFHFTGSKRPKKLQDPEIEIIQLLTFPLVFFPKPLTLEKTPCENIHLQQPCRFVVFLASMAFDAAWSAVNRDEQEEVPTFG